MDLVGPLIDRKNERKYLALWILSLISIPVIIIFAGESIDSYRLLIIPFFLFCLAAILNYEITLGIFIISLFMDVWLLYARPSEVYSLFLILSFLLAYKFTLKDLDNELNKYFLLFVICCLPSFINYDNPITYLSVLRLLVFILVYLVISLSSTNLEKINKIFNIFIIMSVLNGLTVIYYALLTEKRVYGFAGIMYVDYVGIGLTLCLIKILYSDKYKILWIFAFIIQLMALIFTQTRNAWITSGLLLLSLIFQFIFFNKNVKIASIKKLFISFAILVIVVFVAYQAGRFNPTTYERLSALKPASDNELRINTFVTRVFIWNTAWNAFKSNPIIGVGLYNFKFVSKHYNTIDPVLYKLFVEKVSPHETFLEILCETGIIGFIGFSFFLFAWLRMARNNLKICSTERERYIALMIFWSSIFILFSMVMTDIWLQGHGLMLWGIIVGLTIAFKRLLKKNLRINFFLILMVDNKKNSNWLAIQYIIVILSSFITIKLNISHFGTELFGIFILISSYWGFGTLIDLGFGTAMIKFIAQSNKEEDSEFKTLVSTGLIIFLIVGTIIFILGNLLSRIIIFNNPKLISQNSV